jgi:hypothetical protein
LLDPGWGRDTGDDESLPVSYTIIVVRTIIEIGDADSLHRLFIVDEEGECE